MSDTKNQPVRVGTIINGSILLLIAALGLTAAVFDGWSATIIVWSVVAFGGLLIVAGAVGAISRAIRAAVPLAEGSGSAEGHQPID